MNLFKKKTFWVSAAFCIGFSAAIYPYSHDMYVPEAFTLICAFLNLCSGMLFSALLYRKLEDTFPSQEVLGWAWYLFLPCLGHAIFATMSWGSWVCLGGTLFLYLALWRSWRKAHPPKRRLGKAWKAGICLVLALLVLGAGVLIHPLNYTKAFLYLHGPDLETRLLDALRDGEPGYPVIPSGTGIRSFNLWTGEQDMMEFMLNSKGFGTQSYYFGCYYSYADVPLPFQNAAVPLESQGENTWHWQGEGDNWGRTQKLRDHWYFFEASF